MKINHIKLENAAGILVGQNKRVLDIDLTKSQNALISIQGDNGSGKSVLLSSLSPFASTTSLDERSSIPYIIAGKLGYKEIHYNDMGKDIIIKHYFKPNTTGSHSVKSYFQLNGDELNENGNVTSFLSLVEIHMGITPEMMRLIRLGTNVNSFTSLKPADRKSYVGKLIEEIDLYMKVYKKINEDLRILKVLMSTNANNLHNCHITDIIVEKNKLKDLEDEINIYESKKYQLQLKIDKISALETENNLSDLINKRKEIEVSLYDFNKTECEIKEKSLTDTSVDDLIKHRSKIIDNKIDLQANINAMRLSIDDSLSRIDNISAIVKKTISNNDIESLISLIQDLKDRIKNTNDIVKGFYPTGCTSDDITRLINSLSSFNQIGSMMYTFGNKPISIYLKLRRENIQIDSFIKDHINRNLATVGDNEIKRLLSQVFQNDIIITPNCDTEFEECPYYRFSEMINDFRNKVDDNVYDEETLRYLRVVANNVDTILNEIDSLMRTVRIPDGLKDGLYERDILNRLDSKLPLFELSSIQEYLSLLKSYELYKIDLERLEQCEAQLSIYKSSGIDSQLAEIKVLEDNISKHKSSIMTKEKDLLKLEEALDNIEFNIGLMTKFNDSKKYKTMMQNSLNDINKILVPLEESSGQKMELNYKLREYNHTIDLLKSESKYLENRINEYRKLIIESEKLKDKYNKLNIIAESVSTRKGIPLIYMNTYLRRIEKLTNELLSIIYGGDLYIDKFNITADTFEIPYVKNGTVIPDIRYASQSESALMTMALSFALAYNATGKYNILLLDEIDSGLDERNRSAFLQMLRRIMQKIQSEQVFIISQNASQIVNLPMDVIKTTDVQISGKMQHVIYE
jgi:energy-coupling factor transporter ATP-binding protein EcfA2